MIIRNITNEDIGQIVLIHVAACPNDLLPCMGKNFLRKYFYPGIIDSEHCLFLGAEKGGRVKAFLILSSPPSEIFRILGRFKAKAFAALAKIALFHPGLIGQAFSIFLGAKIRLDNSGPNLSDCAEISFLATEPASQGLGIGTQIVEKGLNSLQLLSPNAKGCFVKTSSSNAKKFYEGLGFRPYGEEIRGGKTFEILIVQKSLHSQEPNSKRKSCIN